MKIRMFVGIIFLNLLCSAGLLAEPILIATREGIDVSPKLTLTKEVKRLDVKVLGGKLTLKDVKQSYYPESGENVLEIKATRKISRLVKCLTRKFPALREVIHFDGSYYFATFLVDSLNPYVKEIVGLQETNGYLTVTVK